MRKNLRIAFTRWFDRDYGYALKRGYIRAREVVGLLGALLQRPRMGRPLSGVWHGCREIDCGNQLLIYRLAGREVQLVGLGAPEDFFFPRGVDLWKVERWPESRVSGWLQRLCRM